MTDVINLFVLSVFSVCYVPLSFPLSLLLNHDTHAYHLVVKRYDADDLIDSHTPPKGLETRLLTEKDSTSEDRLPRFF